MTSPRQRSGRVAEQPADPSGLPLVEVDPLGSLEPTTIEVDCLSQTWLVPALSAAEWLKILWSEPFDHDLIFPGLAGADQAVDDAMFDGVVGPDETFEIAMEVLELAAGYRWWFTLKLVTQLKVSWHVLGGMLLLRGIDAREVSLGALCTAALALCLERIGEAKGIYDLLTELNTPPKGYEKEALGDGAEFLAAMRQAL